MGEVESVICTTFDPFVSQNPPSLRCLMDVDPCIDFMCSYHLAEKKIPSIHGHTMGLKLEQFIFDAFPYASTTALFEVTALVLT